MVFSANLQGSTKRHITYACVSFCVRYRIPRHIQKHVENMDFRSFTHSGSHSITKLIFHVEKNSTILLQSLCIAMQTVIAIAQVEKQKVGHTPTVQEVFKKVM